MELLAYKDVSWNRLEKIWPKISSLKMPQSVKKQIRNTAFYDKYTHRLLDEIAQLNKEADLKIGNKFDFRKCSGLSNEVKESLRKIQTRKFWEAKNLPGMTPAAAKEFYSVMLKSDFSKDGNLKTERLKFQKIYNVSRGTLKLFDEYHNFLIKKGRFNLIGSGTKGSIWTRHFAGSYQNIFFLIKS